MTRACRRGIIVSEKPTPRTISESRNDLRKQKPIQWSPNGWTTLADAEAEKHILGIQCRAENGVIVEVRIRHNDGEEAPGRVTIAGKNALPIGIDDFIRLYENGVMIVK